MWQVMFHALLNMVIPCMIFCVHLQQIRNACT